MCVASSVSPRSVPSAQPLHQCSFLDTQDAALRHLWQKDLVVLLGEDLGLLKSEFSAPWLSSVLISRPPVCIPFRVTPLECKALGQLLQT